MAELLQDANLSVVVSVMAICTQLREISERGCKPRSISRLPISVTPRERCCPDTDRKYVNTRTLRLTDPIGEGTMPGRIFPYQRCRA
jgi:hypothetical protein